MSLINLANDLKNEETYKFLEPWRFNDRALTLAIPIIRTKYKERKYILIEEAGSKIIIAETGSIRRIRIINKSDKPVLVRSGTIFEGKTQPRTSKVSTIINPGEKVEIEVFCVDEARPISPKARMRVHERDAPFYLLKESGFRSQHAVWDSIRNLNVALLELPETHGVEPARRGERTGIIDLGGEEFVPRSPTRFFAMPTIEYQTDLREVLKEMETKRSDIIEAIKRFPEVKNQVGVIILDANGVVAMELFDHPDSWKTIVSKVKRKFADELTKKGELPLFKPDFEEIKRYLRTFFDKLASAKLKLIRKGDNFASYTISFDNYIGQFVELYGEAIYLFLARIKKETKEKKKIAIRTFFRGARAIGGLL